MKEGLFVRVYLEKKILFVFRVVMLLVAMYFLWTIYEAFDKGYVIGKGSRSSSHDASFYAYIFRQLVITAFFVWFGTWGAKKKEAGPKT